MCSPRADRQTHIHTNIHESEYRGHPFVFSGNFPSTYHQRSVQSCSSMIPNDNNARISLVNVSLCLNANGIMPCLHDLIIMEMIWSWCVHNVSLDLQIKSYTIHHNLDLSVCDTYFLIRGSMVWYRVLSSLPVILFFFLRQRSNFHRLDFHLFPFCFFSVLYWPSHRLHWRDTWQYVTQSGVKDHLDNRMSLRYATCI